jgi:hypothetical protein
MVQKTLRKAVTMPNRMKYSPASVPCPKERPRQSGRGVSAASAAPVTRGGCGPWDTRPRLQARRGEGMQSAFRAPW